MADITKSLKLLSLLEYSNMPSKFLHKNKGESTFTCGGVYKKANPKAIDWDFIEGIYQVCNEDIERASVMLHEDSTLQNQIKQWSKTNIWDKMKLDEIESQKVADELFLFAFHTHYKTAARVAQRIAGVKADGIIGKISLRALNSFDIDTFDMQFDKKEEEHYLKIIEKKPYLKENIRGWRNRAYRV